MRSTAPANLANSSKDVVCVVLAPAPKIELEDGAGGLSEKNQGEGDNPGNAGDDSYCHEE